MSETWVVIIAFLFFAVSQIFIYYKASKIPILTKEEQDLIVLMDGILRDNPKLKKKLEGAGE